MTQLYLAWNGNAVAQKTLVAWPHEKEPLNILVSYVYLNQFVRDAQAGGYYNRLGRTKLDSGAFSAWRSGKKIDIDALITESKKPYWHESVGLDVIGDAEGTKRQSMYMKAQGSPSYPVFHFGEPWDYLDFYCANFPKVGLSCRFGEPTDQSTRWVEQCFARRWPHKFHSFGWTSDKVLLRVPFHSADSSTWQQGPAAWGTWAVYGGHVPVRGKDAQFTFAANVAWYQRLQARLEQQWGRALATLPP